ncbi:hypothetical protein SKAU_G00175020 [Synaphobranchus kaupii]|uniref:Ras association domain-containing protein 1 n=1 Tax=Synaphobranchus kaupii TaxID=118154 RepID=A0A9Q1J181_SYNKA|nr:hypothetical protein SKAU_G00175020 [Synaphobranchus kaupii]
MSPVDLIELQNLNLDNHIELTTQPVPHRSLRKVPQKLGKIQVVKMQGDLVILGDSLLSRWAGEGHRFQPCSHTQLTCCDLCGDFIWGLYKQSLRCTYCRFTCHYRCRAFIQSDCIPLTDQSDFDDGIVEKDTNVDEEIDWGKCELSVSEVVQKVKEYNAQINGNLPMVLSRDGSYSGFIKVHLRLVGSGSVPQDPKQLHISSRTRACEVIQALPAVLSQAHARKAALYERTCHLGQVRMRRLGEAERPLLLRLCAGPSEDTLSLELQEEDLIQINWDAFALPELGNFLHILQREEEQRVRQIVQRYGRSRLRLQDVLACGAPG